MKSPILGASYVARSVNAADNRMVNLYPEAIPDGGKSQGYLQRTPGRRRLLTVGTGPIRGLWAFGDSLYAVSGAALFRISASWQATNVGTVTGTGLVSMSDNGTQLFVACNPDAFIYNASANAFSQITDPDFPGAKQVGYLDGYFVFIEPNSQRVWITDLFDGQSIDPLDFASAEGSPDNLVGIIIDHREVWLLGTNSAEVWYNAGGADFPLQRIQGAFNEFGCAATFSLAKMDNSVFWLGADARGQGVVYRANGYTGTRISTHAVEWAIQSYGDLSDAFAYTYQQDGHSFYVLTFPTAGKTWVYDAAINAWHERASFNNGEFARIRDNCQAVFQDLNIVGDYEDGRLFALDLEVYEDDDRPQKWLRSWRALPTGQNNLNRSAHHTLQLDCEAGVGLNGIDTEVVLEDIFLFTELGEEILTDTPGVINAWETTGAPAGGLVGWMASDGAGRFVSVQNNQSVYFSDDFGATWTLNQVLVPSPFVQDIKFLNGQFIITVSASTVCYTSPDGETWTPRTISATHRAWRGIAFGNGLYVMVAASTNIYATSPDGITWTERTHPIGTGVDTVVFGAGLFVLMSGAASQYSADGINWTSTSIPLPVARNTAFYGGGLFFAAHSVGPTNLYVTSVDGITWVQGVFPGLANWSAAAYGDGVFVVINSGVNAFGYSSTDAINWVSRPPTLARVWTCIAFSTPYFVAGHFGAQADGNRYRVPQPTDSVPLLLDIKQTQGVNPRVMLRWSDDGGHTWSNEHWREMGRLGEYGRRVIWRRLGMTMKLRDRVYEVSGTDPVKIAIMGAELDVTPTNG